MSDTGPRCSKVKSSSDSADDKDVNPDSNVWGPRPHFLWSVAMVASALIAALAILGAVVYQVETSRPVGEGTLFAEDARRAVVQAEAVSSEPQDLMVRRLRNAFEVEAASLVKPGGMVAYSSAPTLVGRQLTGLLATGLENGWFVAIAQPLETTIEVDGVTEWWPGDVLYDVYQPLSDGGGLILSYDVSELLARRASRAGIQPLTVVLGGVGLTLATFAGLLLLGRAGARRRLETSDFQRRVLVEHNTELGTARAQAERALALAEETNRIRSEFVLMINHELRTPLTSVVTGAELLRDLGESMTEHERTALLGDVLADGRRLSALISQMLTVARIENQGLPYVTRPIPIQSMNADLAAAAPRVTTGISRTVTDAVVNTDPEGLMLLLCSLADNAFTHGAKTVEVWATDSLGFEPVAEVGSRPDVAVFFHVADDGPGIAPDFIDRAFEKFEKTGRASGTGLGLYLARMMVEAVGGSISVATGAGGTVMAVGIPRATNRIASGARI